MGAAVWVKANDQPQTQSSTNAIPTSVRIQSSDLASSNSRTRASVGSSATVREQIACVVCARRLPRPCSPINATAPHQRQSSTAPSSEAVTARAARCSLGTTTVVLQTPHGSHSSRHANDLVRSISRMGRPSFSQRLVCPSCPIVIKVGTAATIRAMRMRTRMPATRNATPKAATRYTAMSACPTTTCADSGVGDTGVIACQRLGAHRRKSSL